MYKKRNMLNTDINYLKEVIKKNDIVIIDISNSDKIVSLEKNTCDMIATIIAKHLHLDKVNIINKDEGIFKIGHQKSKLIKKLNYNEMKYLVIAGSNILSLGILLYAKDNNITIEVKGLDKEKGSIISNEESKECFLYINKENESIKAVFKDIEIFNEIYKNLVEEKLNLKDLIIENNIVYLKGNEHKIIDILNKYL